MAYTCYIYYMASNEPPGVTGFVYLWYDRAKQMFYIGSHFGTAGDKYICSSPWMKRAYKRRPSHFMRRILYWHFSEDRQTLLEREFEWLRKIPSNELGKRFYNLNGGKPGHWIAKDGSLDIKKRISAGTKAAMAREDVRANYLEAISRRDYTQTPGTREKRRQSMLVTMAKKFPPEHRQQFMERASPEYKDFMRQHAADLWQKPGHRESVGAKISASLTGKPRNNGFWWNNGSEEKRSHVCPGGAWARGRLKYDTMTGTYRK